MNCSSAVQCFYSKLYSSVDVVIYPWRNFVKNPGENMKNEGDTHAVQNLSEQQKKKKFLEESRQLEHK